MNVSHSKITFIRVLLARIFISVLFIPKHCSKMRISRLDNNKLYDRCQQDRVVNSKAHWIWRIPMANGLLRLESAEVRQFLHGLIARENHLTAIVVAQQWLGQAICNLLVVLWDIVSLFLFRKSIISENLIEIIAPDWKSNDSGDENIGNSVSRDDEKKILSKSFLTKLVLTLVIRVRSKTENIKG